LPRRPSVRFRSPISSAARAQQPHHISPPFVTMVAFWTALAGRSWAAIGTRWRAVVLSLLEALPMTQQWSVQKHPTRPSSRCCRRSTASPACATTFGFYEAIPTSLRDLWTSKTLLAHLQGRIERTMAALGGNGTIEYKVEVSGESFYTPPGPLSELVAGAVRSSQAPPRAVRHPGRDASGNHGSGTGPAAPRRGPRRATGTTRSNQWRPHPATRFRLALLPHEPAPCRATTMRALCTRLDAGLINRRPECYQRAR
jgi:hypothetical protein